MIKEITREELTELMQSEIKFVMLDVLDKEQFDREHVPGSISLPLAEIGKRADGLLSRKDLIIVYSDSFASQVSMRAAETLISMGYADVLDFAGGLKDYKEAGLAMDGSLHETKG